MSFVTSRWSCFCSIVNSFSMNFTDTLCYLRVECTESVLISTSSISSHMVTRWFCMTKVCTWSMTTSFGLVEGLLDMACFPLMCRYLWNYCTTAWCVWCSWNRHLKPVEFSAWFPLRFWQNLMQYRCWSHSIISWLMKIQWAFTILTHSQVDCQWLTYSTGRKKFVPGMKVPYIHPTRGHLCLICFCWKN